MKPFFASASAVVVMISTQIAVFSLELAMRVGLDGSLTGSLSILFVYFRYEIEYKIEKLPLQELGDINSITCRNVHRIPQLPLFWSGTLLQVP